MNVNDKVERCLKNDGEFHVERFASAIFRPICGYGISLPCKYQGKAYESMERGEKTGILVFPCVYIPKTLLRSDENFGGLEKKV